MSQRCPHDGGVCHHHCTTLCSRKEDGSHLTTPWEGFPIDSNAPVPQPAPVAPQLVQRIKE